jgi:ankyrin repeat protein
LLRETFNNSSALENGVVKWTARVTEVQADKHQEAGMVLGGEDKVVVHFAGWEVRDEYFDQLMLLQQAQVEEEARKKVARAAARLKLEQELVALASTPRVKEVYKMSQHDRNLALIKAAKDGKPDKVKELLAANADVEARDGRGRTPMNHCCQSSGHVGVATLLLDRGAAVNTRCRESGATDLHNCVYWNHLGVAELLVDRGAPVDARDAGGWTPLMQARIHERQELAALLRARGGIAYHATAYGSGMLVSNRILGF